MAHRCFLRSAWAVCALALAASAQRQQQSDPGLHEAANLPGSVLRDDDATLTMIAVLSALAAVMAAPALWRRAAVRDRTNVDAIAKFDRAHAMLRNIAVVLRPSDDGRNVAFTAVTALTIMIFGAFGCVVVSLAAVVLDDGEYRDFVNSAPADLSGITSFMWLRAVCVGSSLFYATFLTAYFLAQREVAHALRREDRCLRAHALAILLQERGFNRARLAKSLMDDHVLGTVRYGCGPTPAGAQGLSDIDTAASRLIALDEQQAGASRTPLTPVPPVSSRSE